MATGGFENELDSHVPFFCDGGARVDVVADGGETHASFIEDEGEAVTSGILKCTSAIKAAPRTPPVSSSSKANASTIERLSFQSCDRTDSGTDMMPIKLFLQSLDPRPQRYLPS